ncbi:MAG: hypothetical protein AAGK98_10795 [Pseudomonadota bacterium]
MKFLASLAVTLFASPAPADPSLKELSGTWADPIPYAYGPAYGHRSFTFDKGAWTLDFTLSFDPAGEVPVFRFRTGGTFTVTGVSPTVDGAWDADFGEDWKRVTLLHPDQAVATGFGLAVCDLTVGEEADISATGCGPWKSVAACPTDHDLLKLTEAGLQFGQRPADNDMCTADRRPTVLTPPVVRQ